MAGPVVAATLTRVAAFSPLLFWPGIVGEFMKYMPITLIATLSASLLYALVFTPTLGAMFAKPTVEDGPKRDGLYMRFVKGGRPASVHRCWPHDCGTDGRVPVAYGKYGNGVEFFPDVEPDYGLLYVHARGNLSLDEKDAAVRMVESRLIGWPGLTSVYTRVGNVGGGGNDVATKTWWA
jgi:multidrug efflux pump